MSISSRAPSGDSIGLAVLVPSASTVSRSVAGSGERQNAVQPHNAMVAAAVNADHVNGAPGSSELLAKPFGLLPADQSTAGEDEGYRGEEQPVKG